MAQPIEAQLSEALDASGEALDLSDTAYETAVARYQAVGTWLGEGDDFAGANPAIFAQGSFEMGTVVKPKIESDEYDIDLVFQVGRLKQPATPKSLHDSVGARLKSDRYKDLLKPDSRCWTLTYKDEFKMDIVPAILAGGASQTKIMIPDKELGQWIASDPKALVEWFKGRNAIRLTAMRKAYADSREVDIAAVPKQAIKTPLQRLVQVLKRNRNLVFGDEKDFAPSSFLITVLAGLTYAGQDNIYDTLKSFLAGVPDLVAQKNGRHYLQNPALHTENVLGSWDSDPRFSQAFAGWLTKLAELVNGSLIATGSDFYKVLATGLGENVKNKAVVILGNRMKEAQSSGRLQIATGSGLLSVSAKAPSSGSVPKTTYYGGE